MGGPGALAFPPSLPPDVASLPEDLLRAAEDLAGALLEAAYRARARATGAQGPGSEPAAAGADGERVGHAPPGVPRLSVSGLIADPGVELRRWVGGLLALGGGKARFPEAVVDLLARLIGSPLPGVGVTASVGPRAARRRRDRPAHGWRVVAAVRDRPAVAGAGPRHAEPRPVRQPRTSATGGWRPGDPGLSGEILAEGISLDAGIDDLLADTLAGRGPLADGFAALVERWGGTDGVLALPDDLVPTGVPPTGRRTAAHHPLDSPVMAEALAEVWEELGGTPARLVLVGVVAEGEPDLLPPAAAQQVDLTLADAPVEAFAVPAPAGAGTTSVRLAGKAAAAASGGGDGFAGQVARLRRAFEGLTGGGTQVVVVAAGAAGRPTVQAAAGLPGVTAVVTVAAPWSPLSLDDIDVDPATGALRMLRTLIDLADADLAAELAAVPEPERAELSVDDEDLALAHGLVGALLARDGRGDPLTELSAPDQPVPAGLAVHAVIGSSAPEAVGRAITAAVAAGLAGRSRRRVAAPAPATPGTASASARLGVHVPTGLGSTAGGLRARARPGPGRVRCTDAGVAGPALRIRLRIAGDGRWLLGGPDRGRSPGARPLAVRAMTLDLTLAMRPGGRVAGRAQPSPPEVAWCCTTPRRSASAGPAGSWTSPPGRRYCPKCGPCSAASRRSCGPKWTTPSPPWSTR